MSFVGWERGESKAEPKCGSPESLEQTQRRVQFNNSLYDSEAKKVDSVHTPCDRPFFPSGAKIENFGTAAGGSGDSVLWTIPGALELLKMSHGTWMYSKSFECHGKMWVIQFSPSLGKFAIFLIDVATHISSFTIETRTSKMFLTSKCEFTKGVPFGFEEIMPMEEILKDVETDGSWKFIVTIDPEGK